MCRKKPGPRCSPHAKKALESALASGNEARIAKARQNWNASPEGFRAFRDAAKKARDQGDHEHAADLDAKAMQYERAHHETLNAWRVSTGQEPLPFVSETEEQPKSTPVMRSVEETPGEVSLKLSAYDKRALEKRLLAENQRREHNGEPPLSLSAFVRGRILVAPTDYKYADYTAEDIAAEDAAVETEARRAREHRAQQARDRRAGASTTKAEGGRGRPRTHASEKRDEVVHVWLSAEEKAALRNNAYALGLTMNERERKRALTGNIFDLAAALVNDEPVDAKRRHRSLRKNQEVRRKTAAFRAEHRKVEPESADMDANTSSSANAEYVAFAYHQQGKRAAARPARCPYSGDCLSFVSPEDACRECA